jgi:hypothetical protein
MEKLLKVLEQMKKNTKTIKIFLVLPWACEIAYREGISKATARKTYPTTSWVHCSQKKGKPQISTNCSGNKQVDIQSYDVIQFSNKKGMFYMNGLPKHFTKWQWSHVKVCTLNDSFYATF